MLHPFAQISYVKIVQKFQALSVASPKLNWTKFDRGPLATTGK